MANWTYRCYDDGKSSDLWRRWYQENPKVRGAHNAAFEMLEQMEVWAPPNFKALGKDLYEVKFFGQDKRQWRVFGTIDLRNKEFIVLTIGYHKDRNYTPSNVMTKARERLYEIRENIGKAPACERPGKEAA